jgi:TPR repeat protein
MNRLLRQFICLALWLAASNAATADTVDARAYLQRAIELIEAGELRLARTYLAPALIDPRLSAVERSHAYYVRGYSFLIDGLPVSASKDYARALEFNADNGPALVGLGDLYHRGVGVDEDPELAYAFFESAAEVDHPEASLFIGFALLQGRGVEQDVDRAREILSALVEEGSDQAMLYLGRSYREPFAPDPDPDLAREWIEQAAEAGSVEAKATLGYMHYKGEFGEPDMAEAVRLFEEAAAEGSNSANVALGHMYLVGDGLPTDPTLARQLLEQAAEAGDLAGALSLGHIYEAGIGVERDLLRAESWYLKGAHAGFGQAQLRLFYLLLGRGEETNAVHWIAKAAEQDLAQAQNDYAWLLSTSQIDAIRDGELALTYAEKAVAQVESAAYLDTLAAAYAELGRFPEAVSIQEQALTLVTEAGSEEARALAEHLAAYQAGEPWRE